MHELEKEKWWPEDERSEDDGRLSETEKLQVEACFRALSTEVFVSSSLANLYTSRGNESSWKLQYMGIPVILLDRGEARSRTSRGIRIVLAERGTCFTLWQDKVDNLTSYKLISPSFHTMCLSTDHSVLIGLSFDNKEGAIELGSHVEKLISCPENINLSMTKGKVKTKKPPPRILPAKSHISQPCCFQHVTSVNQADIQRYVSLQKLLPPTHIQKN